MPSKKLKAYLDENNVKYVTIRHSPAYTAQEIAAAAHIPGGELAKTVILKVDGEFVMASLPASEMVNLESLKQALGASSVELASESEFANLFPDCEPGAMPPFGNLFDMSVYASSDLAKDERIAFSAGSHSELIQLTFDDFSRLVRPKMLEFAAPA